MPVLSEIESQIEDISGDIFPDTWNCQILFCHNQRNLSGVANLGYNGKIRFYFILLQSDNQSMRSFIYCHRSGA